MTKLDRLGWAAGMSYASFGVRFGIRVNDAAILKMITPLLPPESQPTSIGVVDHLYSVIGNRSTPNAKVRAFNLAYWNLSRIERTRKLDDMLETIASHIQLTIAEHAPRRVFVHAGVVGWNGHAIVIPGRSHSGKSTLVKELISAGATYYSDEYAVFNEDGSVIPFARPLAIRDPETQTPNRITAEALGAATGSKSLPVGLVVATRFRENARWRPRGLSQGKGILELFANTVSARSRPAAAFSILPKVLRSARILKGTRGAAAEVVESILAHCGEVGSA